MACTALFEDMQWTLDAGSNYWMQDPWLAESSFQMDVDPSVYPAPTGVEAVQVAEDDLLDLDLVDAFASTSESSVYTQPIAAYGLESCISPSSTPSSSDVVSMAINQASVFEGFQWSESEDPSSCSTAQSVAEESNAASGTISTPPQPLILTWTVPDQDFAVDRQSAGFDFEIEPGKKKNGKFVKAAPWTFSELLNKLFVDKEKTCPVTFKSTIPAQLQGQFRVVVYVSFAGVQYVHERVRRCPEHAKGCDPESKPLLGCHHPGAKDENRDRHHAVVVPLDVNNAGQLSAVALFTFSCWNTCSSIVDEEGHKRALKLHFRLETRSGQMVDEKAVDLKLCSCTGRDIKNEEARLRSGK
jgi:hypothetical protein